MLWMLLILLTFYFTFKNGILNKNCSVWSMIPGPPAHMSEYASEQLMTQSNDLARQRIKKITSILFH